MMHVTHLPWDSGFFGFTVVKITSDHVFDDTVETEISALLNDSCRLVYYFTSPNTPVPDEKLHRLNGRLVDKKLTFYKNIDPTTPPAVNEKVVLYNGKKSDKKLQDLALLSGSHSRFKIDRNFAPGSFEKLYSLWITNSLNCEIADYVYVYEENNTIFGLITLKANVAGAVIGLLSVSENAQGKGVGRSLVQRAEKECVENGIKKLLVATQGDNTSACRFYQKTGFQIMKQELVYHFWAEHENTL